MADGSVQLRSTMEQDASIADFDQLATEMKATGGARAGKTKKERRKEKLKEKEERRKARQAATGAIFD